MKVGFIGLGHMGVGMAANLLQAGHDVTVYNRSPGRAEALIAQGGKAAAVVAEACRGDAVITMLANDEAVDSVAFQRDGIMANLSPGALHISSSTISVALSERLSAAHAKSRQLFVAAPVFGRPDVAAAGRLFVVAGGERVAVESAAPLLQAIGQRTYVISDKPKSANLVKLSGKFLSASVIESLGEAFAVVAKAGVDRKQYLELLTSSLFDTPTYKTYGELIGTGVSHLQALPHLLGKRISASSRRQRNNCGCPCRSRACSAIASSLSWRMVVKSSTGRRSAACPR